MAPNPSIVLFLLKSDLVVQFTHLQADEKMEMKKKKRIIAILSYARFTFKLGS